MAQDLGVKPKGWFSRRHESRQELNEARDMYGTRADRKAARQASAKERASHTEHDNTKAHRLGRCKEHGVPPRKPRKKKKISDQVQG
jgi:hypothetical protein